MKKKNQPPPSTTTDPTTTTTGDIKSIVHDYSTFFDKLVELIPPRFYLPSSDDKPWFQGLSKSAKSKAKLKSIQNIKQSRRDRLDPSKSSKTTLDFLKESLKDDNNSDDDGESGDDDVEGEKDDGREVTYEELRERLRNKIEELRGGRGGGGSVIRREKREEWKRKRSEEEEKKEEEEKERENIEKKVVEGVSEIEFGKVKLAAHSDDALFNKKKKRKLSKEEDLKRALELEEAKKDPEKGDMVKKNHAWKAANDRAMGIKVHDNPTLLKKSLHKEMKKQEKSKKKWKDRVKTTKKMSSAKQEKRKENISVKLNHKKQSKIEKREKKLLRPGFEGRKEGFVTKD